MNEPSYKNVSQLNDKDQVSEAICKPLVSSSPKSHNEQAGAQMDRESVGKVRGQVVSSKQDQTEEKRWKWTKSNLYLRYSPKSLASFRRSSDSNSSQDVLSPKTSLDNDDYVDESFVSFGMENQSPKNISAKTHWIKDQVASFIAKRIPSKSSDSQDKSEGLADSSDSVLPSSSTSNSEGNETVQSVERTSKVSEPVVMKLEYDINGSTTAELQSMEVSKEVPEVAFVDKAGLSSLDEKEMAYLEFIEARDNIKSGKVGGKDSFDDVNPVSLKRPLDQPTKAHWIKDHVTSLLSKTKGHSKTTTASTQQAEGKMEIKQETVVKKDADTLCEETVEQENPSFGDLHSSFQSKLSRLSVQNDPENVTGSQEKSESFEVVEAIQTAIETEDVGRPATEETEKAPLKKEDKRKLSSVLKMIGSSKQGGTGERCTASDEEQTHESATKSELEKNGKESLEGETLAVPGDQGSRSSGSSTPPSPATKKKSAKGQKIKGILTMSNPMTHSTDLTHLPSPSPTSSKGKGSGSPNPASRKFPNPSKAFKIPKKLTFSELLHSQEGTRLSPDDDPNKEDSGESLSASPIQRPEKEGEDSDDSLDPKELETLVKQSSGGPMDKEHASSISYFHLWVTSVIFYGFLLSSPSPFITGLVYGVLFMYLLGCFIVWLLCPSGKSYQQYKTELKEYLAEQEKGSPVKQPQSTSALDPTHYQKPRDLKGWLHFTLEYEQQSFSLSETKDVFVVLRGETIHIFKCKPQPEGEQLAPENLPKVKQGLRRSKKNRKIPQLKRVEPAFFFEREHRIDLTKCSITIKPLDLPMRRIWNRKYPIELTIPPGVMYTIDPQITFEDLQLNFDEYFRDNSNEGVLNSETEVFYLLPNTGREKEDWFYRMQLCIKPLKHQITIENYQKGKIPKKAATSYAHYVVEVVSESQTTLQKGRKGVKLEPHLAWFNALLGRAFWDVWHEPYWYAKVKQKIQHRLNKLNTPPFIKDIFIRDLHLGHTLPVIHKGSLPVLDEYGIWVDLQVTYKGEFTLTLETQLNVEYYAQLVATIIKQQEQINADNTEGLKVKAHLTKQEEHPSESSVEEVVSELQEQLPEIYLEAIDTVEIDEEDLSIDQDADSMLNDPKTKAFLQSKTGKRVAGVVGWLAKSKIAKRVAETEFAKKAYEKAYEKFQKMPIILKVEVQSLKGTLAVNMPPPPSNRLWFGFRGNPAVLITAQPRIGERQVRLTYLTDWIERKLKEEFKKVFVLPAMQDFSIKIMNSRLQELFPERPLT